jgi:hypothetical protein
MSPPGTASARLRIVNRQRPSIAARAGWLTKGAVFTPRRRCAAIPQAFAIAPKTQLSNCTGTVSDAIETGKQPGMPLDILANAVRKAPLAALGIAFLLGFMFAQPR